MTSNSDSVIILAAGDGSRMKSSIPKVFHKIGGLSLLDHVIKTANALNPKEIIAVTKPTYSLSDLEYGEFAKQVFQENPRGSGHAVKCAIDSLSQNDTSWVYILYADIPLISSEILLKLSEVSKTCDKTGVVVLAMESGGSKGLGKLEPAESPGTIKGIIEAKDASKFDKTIPLCNTGLFIKKNLLKKLIDDITPSPVTGEFYITEIVRLAYENGYVCRYCEGDSEELSGINNRCELSNLEKYFQEKMRKKHMDNGVTLVAPETVFFSHDTIIENDVTVHPYVIFLKNVKVKSGSSIGPFCVIDGSDIKNANVGPFARLRSGSEINEGAKIGNFVEIKNTVVSENAKINHLSYIGDSHIGKQTNIGAGTITCNYNGFNKYKTQIGENVFIGSNSAIVAPVQICDNAMVGAGSVITKNINNNDLAVARSHQINIIGGAEDFRKKHRKEKK